MDNANAVLRDLISVTGKVDAKATETAGRQIALAGLVAAFARALIISHPDQDALRDSWDHEISAFWEALGEMNPAQTEYAKAVIAMTESAFADRAGAAN